MTVSNSTKKSPAPISKATQLNALKPRDSEYEVRVSDCPGLRLRVSPQGKMTWFHRYRSPATGKVVKYTLGVYLKSRKGEPLRGTTLATAKQKWLSNHDLLLHRRDPRAEMIQTAEQDRIEAAANQSRAEATVAQLVQDHIKEVSNENLSRFQKSWRETQRTLTKYLVEFPNGNGRNLGDKPAFDLTRKDIKDALGELREQGKDSQANRALASIRSMFNWALENDWPNESDPLPFNPCGGLKATKEQPRQRALNDTELRQVLARLPQVMDVQTSDFLLFCLATGCRIGEAATMQYGDLFNEADGYNEWRQPPGKNTFIHTVYLSDYARAILRRQPGHHRQVWNNPHSSTGCIGRNTVANRLDQSMPELGVDKFTAHDLRRTFTTWLGNQGIDERVHDRVLNHQTGGIRRVYNVARYDRQAKEAWQKWGQHLQALSSPNVIGIKEDQA